MEHFDLYRAKKNEVIKRLTGLREIVAKLENVGLDVHDDISKIGNAIKDVEDNALRVALIGAFADGKTSVIAGWLGRVVTNMKIDLDESSDELTIYHPDDLPEKCEIIDTPGLFGNKTKYAMETEKEAIQYGDITKKYLSEAHLIFYVVDATNPLKDSHKNDLEWILRKLNKLSSTVFVINKMDEVADLRDADDFLNQSKIKKENLLNKLTRFLDLSTDEISQIQTVCVSSNPQNRGLDYWLDKKEIYEERSRIGDLKKMTNDILDKTCKDVFITKTGFDVLNEIIRNKIAAANDEYAKLNLFEQNKFTEIQRIEEDITKSRASIISAKTELVQELISIENQLNGRIRVLSLKDIKGFLEDEIGYSKDDIGYKLKLRIENACERCLQYSTDAINGIKSSIEKELESSDNFIASISSSALRASGKALGRVSQLPIGTIKDGVFAARDAMGKLTGMVIKFKPWEASKIAANISRYAGPIAAGISVIADCISTAMQHKAEKQLKETQSQITEMVKEHFKPVYEMLADHKKVLEMFAPQIAVFEEILSNQKTILQKLIEKKNILESVKKQFESNRLS